MNDRLEKLISGDDAKRLNAHSVEIEQLVNRNDALRKSVEKGADAVRTGDKDALSRALRELSSSSEGVALIESVRKILRG